MVASLPQEFRMTARLPDAALNTTNVRLFL
jgi:hypothetical protein